MSKKRKSNSGNPAKPRVPKTELEPGDWWSWIRTAPTLDGKSWMITLEFDEDKEAQP